MENDPDQNLNYILNDISEFFPMVLSQWIDEEGLLDMDKVDESLTQLEKIAQHLLVSQKNYPTDTASFFGAGMLFNNNVSTIGIGWLEDYSDFEFLFSSIRDKENQTLFSFPSENGGAYLPQVVLGINSQSTKINVAKSFVSFVLSEPVLSTNLSDGLPIHLKALENNAKSPKDELDGVTLYSSGYYNADKDQMDNPLEFAVRWPTEEEFQAALTIIEELRVPLLTNQVIEDMVTEDLELWLVKKSQDKSTTLENITRKLELYLAEG